MLSFEQTLMKLNLEENLSSYCVTVGAAIELRNNPVIYNVNLSYSQISLYFLMQALLFLDLSGQKIDEKGIEYLTNALKTNQVILPRFFLILQVCLVFISQTVKVLNLSSNEIGSQGIKFITDVLRINKVT